MKNYKSIACTDFVNVNIALINLCAYEENQSFYTRVHTFYTSVAL